MENLHKTIIKEYVSIILFEKYPRNIWVNKRINSEKEFYNHWQCPGGHVEVTDISTQHAAQRELLEETGIKARLKDLKYERTNHYYRKNEWRMVHCYFLKTKEKPNLTEPEEMTTWQMKNVYDILKEPVIDSLKDAFKGGQKECRIIMIEGTCGAGKSTLAQMCKKYFQNQRKTVEVMDELFITQDPQERIVDYGKNLKRFKENKITRGEMIIIAIKLETWIRNTWMKQIYEFMIRERKPDILIMDRNLFSTEIFMDVMDKIKIYPKEDQRITCENYKYWEFLKREAEVIWWNTPVDESINRLIKRGRAGEEDLEYYQNLNQAYKKCMPKIYSNMKIITRETLLTEEQLVEVLPTIFGERIIEIEY